MAISQIVPIYITLKGDGSNTVFTFALANLYQQGFGGSVPFGTAGVVPSSIAVNNPPVAVTSATVDANGNITITLTTALGAGIVQTFELDLIYNSGAASSSSATQSQTVTVTGSAAVTATQLPAALDGSGYLKVHEQGTANVSIQNASLPVTQNTASNLNATVVGTGTFAVQAALNAETTKVIGVVRTADGSGNLLTSTSNALDVNLKTSAASVTVAQGTAANLLCTASQGGTWTVQPGNTPNSTAWLVKDSADMSGTVPGTAPSNTLITGGIYNSSAPTPSTGQTLPLQLDASGNLNVNVKAGSSGNAAASATGSAVPSSADYIGVNISGNLVGVTGVSLTNAKAAAVAIVDGSGNQITSFGGGTQYAEGTTAATATGTVMMGKNSTTIKAVQTDSSGNLVVVQATAANLNATVTGTVAATQSGTWNVGSLTSITNAVTVSQSTASSLNATVVQATASNLNATVVTNADTAIAGTTAPSKGLLILGKTADGTPAYDPMPLAAGGGSVVVSGTVAATQSGTWTVGISASQTIAVTQATAANLNATVTGTVGATQSGTWSNKITDGTNTAAVKAASTAPATTDPALVVTTSPNSGEFTDTIGAAGTLNALNAVATISAQGEIAVGMQLAAGTLIGTIVPEVSFDGGTTWNVTYFDTSSNGKVASIVFGSSNTATAATLIGAGGASYYRVRVSAFTSGTASCTLRGNTIHDPSVLYAGPSGVTPPPAIAQIGGSDGTNLQVANITSKGTQGTRGVATQDLKDSGRNQVTLYVDSVTGITTEALATLNITKGLATQTAATSYTVTAGKTFRVQSLTVHVIASTTTAVTARVRVRTAGTVSATSPVVLAVGGSTPAAVALTGGFMHAPIADGLEIAGGNQIGLSHIESSAVTGSTTTGAGVSFCLVGYEY